jgi:hypothetical protein
VYVDANRNWVISGTVIPTPVPPTPIPGPAVTQTQASYQPFDGGFMVWESHTGNVVAFYNNGGSLNASYTVYTAPQYVNLPDNPVTTPTPFGRVRPAFGIGKVWGNFLEVRNNLGWALTPEQGFLATFISSSNSTQSQTCFTLPDGRPITFIRLNTGVKYWLYSGTC